MTITDRVRGNVATCYGGQGQETASKLGFQSNHNGLLPFMDSAAAENPEYLSRQLLTYLGNKRALLSLIGRAIECVKKRLDRPNLRSFDVFSGSGVVSRFLKAHSSYLASNDLEGYAATTSRCYLSNKSEVHLPALKEAVEELNIDVGNDMVPGFVEELYAPKDEENITPNDRVFYTKENARRLDNYRRLVDAYPLWMRDLLVAPLLSFASVNVNTSGVFKGFHKNRKTGIGQYGGSRSDALSRIMREIRLEPPVLSNYECEYVVLQDDANVAAATVGGVDLAYIDPPYNQHPYGSNYFMLNLLDAYRRPERISRVSGIPMDWKRSGYNVRTRSLPLMKDLLETLDAKFMLVSFNDESFIPLADMRYILSRLGTVAEFDTKYNTFRGCRNIRDRSIHVTEHLFLLERF